MTTQIEEIARWTESLSFKDIPSSVTERTKYQILNMVAAAHAGAISPASQKLMAAVRKWDSGGNLPVFATGETMSLQGALFANAALSMAHDFDDYLLFGHTGHSAVFASLLIGMAEGKSPQDIIAATVLGNEIGGRLGAACVIGPQNGQMWTHIHVAETAAIAAKLMGLDKKGIANAIAIGFYQPPFALIPGFMGPDTKILSAAQTSLAGLMAAQLAAEDFTGPLDILENPRGFLAQFSYAPMGFMLSGWGKSWVTDSLAYKVVPGCAYIDTCVDAMKMILDKFNKDVGRELAPADVREIEVRASLLTIGMNHMSEDHVGRGVLNPISINFSIPANVAILILTGDLRADNLDPDWLDLHREDILALCRRVNLVHDWEMTAGVTEALNKVLDLGRIVDAVGISKLLKARRKAADHFGAGVSLGIKDLLEIRKQGGPKGKERLNQVASGVWKRVLGGKKRAGSAALPPDLGECDFTKFTMPFAAEVTLKTTKWKEYSARQEIPWGSPGQPWEDTKERLQNKFRVEAGRHLSDGQIDWVIKNIDRLEKTDSIKSLIENLVQTPGKKTAAAKRPVAAPPKKTEAVKRPAPPQSKKTEAPKRPPSSKPAKPDLDLPPIAFEPVKTVKSEKPKRTAKEKAPPKVDRPEKSKPVPRAKPKSDSADKKKPASKAQAKTGSVSMRKAMRGEKTPRPPKGGKRRRVRRP